MSEAARGLAGRARPFGLWERMLAIRYLRARRSQGGVGLISVISFIGITLAVATLIIVMSVMNGFRSELLSRILGFQGHVYVTGGVLDGPARDLAAARILKVPGVIQAAPIIEAQAIAVGPSQITGALVRGIRPSDLRGTTLVSGNITKGDLKGFGVGDYGGDVVVVGERLAQTLGVAPGDTVSLISPSGGATAFGGTPLQKAYTVGATFSVGMSQYDQAYIYMPLSQAQLFFGREDTADAIEVRVADPDNAAKMKAAINTAAGPAALVTDWAQRDSSYWGALQVERVVMRLILMLLVAIAAMNIISGLVMLVKNKGRDIAILRTIGAGLDPQDFLHGRGQRWRAGHPGGPDHRLAVLRLYRSDPGGGGMGDGAGGVLLGCLLSVAGAGQGGLGRGGRHRQLGAGDELPGHPAAGPQGLENRSGRGAAL